MPGRQTAQLDIRGTAVTFHAGSEEVEAPGLDADYRRELIDELRKTAQASLGALVRDSEAIEQAARAQAQQWGRSNSCCRVRSLRIA